MRPRIIFLVSFILLLAAFAGANWSVFVAPTELSLLFTRFTAPLGLLMLGVILGLVAAFAIYMAVWQTHFLLEVRQLSKELERQRELADQAEASRFSALDATLHAQMAQLAGNVDRMGESVRAEVRDQANSLAAAVAEMDDRLGRSQT